MDYPAMSMVLGGNLVQCHPFTLKTTKEVFKLCSVESYKWPESGLRIVGPLEPESGHKQGHFVID